MSTTSVIVFASQKGGSGKTTLSGHVAVQAQLAGAGPVAVIDTDPQRSLAQWRYAREDNSLILKASGVEQIAGDIQELSEVGARVIIVDTPPAATSAIGEVVRHADLVVIPTRPSPHDLRAVGATIDIVESHRKPMIFVLNSAARRARITTEAAVALSQHGTVAPTIVHNRVDFAASMTDGRTVMEVADTSKSASEISTLWDYIVTRLGKTMELRQAESEVAASGEPVAPAVTAESDPVAVATGETLAPKIAPAAERYQDNVATVEASAPSAAAETTVPEPAVATAEAAQASAAEDEKPRVGEQFFGARPIVKTPTYFGPDRRNQDRGSPGGGDRRQTAFGRRVAS